MAKKLKSKKSQVLTENVFDYYVHFKLNKNASEKEIQEVLRTNLNQVRQMLASLSSCANGSNELARLQEEEKRIHAANNIFRKKETRVEYDEKLELAIAAGKVDVASYEIADDIYAEIEKMFAMGDFNGVIRKCQDLISSGSSEVRLYTYVARSYFMSDRNSEAIVTVDKCVDVHPNDLNALQLASRYYNMCNNDIQKSQEFINRMLEIDAESSLAVCEQVYLYLCMGNREMAYKTCDDYINAHPTDEDFRESCAIDMISYTYRLFVEDESGASLLISQEAYDECLEVSEKAASIFADEDIKAHLDYTRQFGEIVYNEDNKTNIRWTFFASACYAVPAVVYFVWSFMALFIGVGFLKFLEGLLGFLLLGALSAGGFYSGIQLHKVSKRPYWQIFKYELTGKREKREQIFVTIGNIVGGWMRLCIKFFWWLLKVVIRSALPG